MVVSTNVIPELAKINWSRWVEVHPLDKLEAGLDSDGNECKENAEYFRKLPGLNLPLWLKMPDSRFPEARIIPWAKLRAWAGDFFLTSTISQMMALALYEGVTDLGIWGVDMGAGEEWKDQRAGAHHFIEVARLMGVKVHMPPESALLFVPPPYPEVSLITRRARHHLDELNGKQADNQKHIDLLKQSLTTLELKRAKLEGWIEGIELAERNWSNIRA